MSSDHSITIRNNCWYDHATGKGGGAIDFVMMFYGKSFPGAVTMLLEGEQGQAWNDTSGNYVSRKKESNKEGNKERSQESNQENNHFAHAKCSRERHIAQKGEYLNPAHPEETSEIAKPFALPKANANMRRVFAYLTKTRHIDAAVVSFFAHAKLLYEDERYHNAVFVGTDKDGIACHAHKRGTYTQGQPFKGNVDSSDPHYSFHYIGTSDTVFVFEAPIDMLSFITLHQSDWQQHSYVALCGVIEHALLQTLTDYPHIQKIGLCLDNDEAGIKASERIKITLSQRGYDKVFSLFSSLKDWNEDLQKLHQEQKNQEQTEKQHQQNQQAQQIQQAQPNQQEQQVQQNQQNQQNQLSIVQRQGSGMQLL